MTYKRFYILLSVFISLMMLSAFRSIHPNQEASATGTPAVKAVLFFSPTCGHCIYVRSEIFPPLLEKYDDQLDIFEIDVTLEAGKEIYLQTLDYLDVPAEQRMVPFLLIEETYLAGSIEIPAKFPELIDEELKGDGTEWPQVPGLLEYIQTNVIPKGNPAEIADGEAANDSQNPQPLPVIEINPEVGGSSDSKNSSGADQLQKADEDEPPLFLLRFRQDVAGNSVAVVTLLLMFGVVIYTGVVFMRAKDLKLWPWWITPLLVILGIGIAAYLSFVEVSGSEAICGPVGDCNAVQNSPYARLFGVLHVGVLGIIGYVLIGIAWIVGRWGKQEWRSMANMAMFLFSLFGLLFSIYLTFLEPFVIGATCMWCISSAIVMTLMVLNTTPIALSSWMLYDEELEDEFDDGDDAST